MTHDQKQTCSCTGKAGERCEEDYYQGGQRSTPTETSESTGAPLAEKDIVRFWSKVDKNGPLPDQTNPHYAGLDRCWVWTAGKRHDGYGQCWVGNKTRTTHRTAWEITNGAAPKNIDGAPICIIHRCDLPTCCNPNHLRLGTQKDNMDDMMRKGRKAIITGDEHHSRRHPERLSRGDNHRSRLHPEVILKGEKHGQAKITDAQALAMRMMYVRGGPTQAEIGAMFGVGHSTVSQIVNCKRWKHLPLSTPDWI